MSGLLSQFRQKITSEKLLQKQYYKLEFAFEQREGGSDIESSQVQELKGNFDLYAQSASIPGKNLTTLEVKKHAFSLKMPDQVTFDGTWSVNVLLNLSLSVYKRLLDWQAQYSSLECDMGGTRGFPSANAKVYLLNNLFKTDGSAGLMTIYGIFPTKVPQIDLSQEESAYLTPTVEFAYSYHDDFTQKDVLSEGKPGNVPTARGDRGTYSKAEGDWT